MLTATTIRRSTISISARRSCGECAMNRLFTNSISGILIGMLSLLATAQSPTGKQWIGTWATAPQPPEPGHVKSFRNQTLRLIVHISTGGTRVRVKISNTFGDQPLVIGSAHLARRTDVANIDPNSDRTLRFEGKSSTTVAAGSTVVSDPVAAEVPALSNLAVIFSLPERTGVKPLHFLPLQTSYVSETGDATANARFPVAKEIDS